MHHIYTKLDIVAKTKKLAELLVDIEENYTNYEVRYDLVLSALFIARQLDYKCGFRFDPGEPEWPVIVIYLHDIDKEISWHMPPCDMKYDGICNQNSVRTQEFAKLFL